MWDDAQPRGRAASIRAAWSVPGNETEISSEQGSEDVGSIGPRHVGLQVVPPVIVESMLPAGRDLERGCHCELE